MKFYLPQNVFTEVFTKDLTGFNINFSPTSLIIRKIKEIPDSIGFIPVTDLINNRDLFVSKSKGISFESTLCNTYIYYTSQQKDNQVEENKLREVNLTGDISTAEVILSKILFKEIYDTEVEVKIWKDIDKIKTDNLIITGDDNFKDERFKSGISFSETIIDTLNIPYVNYVIASPSRELIEKTNNSLENIGNLVYNRIEEGDFGNSLSRSSKNYIMENVSSLVIDFEENDIEGINQLIKLPYYHGMVDDIFDINFVG
jgi:hypothetical protein